MIVTCPGCSANYRVRNEAVPEGGARMKCPKCSTMFLAKPPPKKDAPPAQADPFAAPIPPVNSPSNTQGVPTGQFPSADIAAALSPQGAAAFAQPPIAASPFGQPASPPVGFPSTAAPAFGQAAAAPALGQPAAFGQPPVTGAFAAAPASFPAPASALGQAAAFGQPPVTGAFAAAPASFPAPASALGQPAAFGQPPVTGAFAAAPASFPAPAPAPAPAVSAAFSPPPSPTVSAPSDPFAMPAPSESADAGGFDLVPNTYHPDSHEDAFGNDNNADVLGLHLDINRGAEPVQKIKPLHLEKNKDKSSSSSQKQALVRSLQSAAAGLFMWLCFGGSAFVSSLGAWGFGAPFESFLLPFVEKNFSVRVPYSSLEPNEKNFTLYNEQADLAQKRGDLVGELLFRRRAQVLKSNQELRERISTLVAALNAKGSLRGR